MCEGCAREGGVEKTGREIKSGGGETSQVWRKENERGKRGRRRKKRGRGRLWRKVRKKEKNKRECKREKGTERVKGEREREKERGTERVETRVVGGEFMPLDNASASAPSSAAPSFSLSVLSLFFYILYLRDIYI